MSELKTRFIDDTYLEYFKTGKHDLAQIYLKSEADKVIADKNAKIELYKRGWEESDRINEHLYAQLRHNKFKRCLAMAQVLEHVCPITNRKSTWRDKWHKRWLELAEKFKEAK